MFLILLLTDISIGSLLHGYMTETVTLMAFGIGLIISSVGLRKVLKSKDNSRKNVEATKEISKN